MALQRTEEIKMKRHVEWSNPFDGLKSDLDEEFKCLVSKINSIDLSLIGSPIKLPKDSKRILATNPILVILRDDDDGLVCVSKEKENIGEMKE